MTFADSSSKASPNPESGRFKSTHWSVVLKAGESSSTESRQALETLCRTYWYPLYAFLRRRGRGPQDAEDLTQEFLARVVEKKYLRSVDPQRGRFRSFLLTLFQRFVASETDRQYAQKRGGGVNVLSLDFESGEARYGIEPVEGWTPEKLYQRRWALTLLDQVVIRLREDYDAKGKRALYDECQVYLTGADDNPRYAETAKSLGMTEGAVRVAVHRMREHYRRLLVEEVAQTLEDSEDVDTELQLLQSALRGE